MRPTEVCVDDRRLRRSGKPNNPPRSRDRHLSPSGAVSLLCEGACVGEAMKILLVDDHALFRVGLRMLLATVGEEVKVIETATVSEALMALEAHADVQLCLLDLALKAESGLAAIELIKNASPKVSIVVVSGVDDNATIRRLHRCRCHEFRTEARASGDADQGSQGSSGRNDLPAADDFRRLPRS